MNLDLMSIYERNKKLEKLEEKIAEQEIINELIENILHNRDNYTSYDNKVLNKIGIKYKSIKCKGFAGSCVRYIVKMNKTNITKIQKYIEKLGDLNE